MEFSKRTRSLLFKSSFSFISLLFLLAFTTIAAVANAQTTNTEESTTAEETVQPEASSDDLFSDIRDQRDELQAEQDSTARVAVDPTPTTPETTTTEATAAEAVASPVETVRTDLGRGAQIRATNLAANISNRLDATVRRLEQILYRFDSRIATLETEGVDVATAAAIVRDARGELASIKVALEDIDAQVSGVTGSNEPRSAWNNLKTQYRSIQTSLKQVHALMGDALTALQLATTTPAAETETEDL